MTDTAAASDQGTPTLRRASSVDTPFGTWIFVGLLGTCALAAIWIVAHHLTGRPDLWDGANDAAAMGQRGDFFGGFLNPILTTLTFTAFLLTILMQRAELKATKAQFEASENAIREQAAAARTQTYQAGVFQLLSLYDNVAASMSIVDPANNKTVEGRAAFRVMYSDIRRTYRKKRADFHKADEAKVVLLAFETVYREQHHQLPHYFRVLYNCLTMIEDGPESEKYIRVMRAAISNQELLVLFYNCAVSAYGVKFKALAEKHALFDNMSPRLLEDSHAAWVAPEAFGPGGYAALKEAARPTRGDFYERPPE